MSNYPKRLIEVDLPIARISAHARREKSIRHGHISTLHIWWARRPLAACRAVICASLWPDPEDLTAWLNETASEGPMGPEIRAPRGCKPGEGVMVRPRRFLNEACEQMLNWATRHAKKCSSESMGRLVAVQKDASVLEDPVELRRVLLDFIADFANWDNSTDPAFLETARALTQAAHEALGGEPGTRPLVVDPFAGGGSIPLEALRVGADAFASDLNPVAVLLNQVIAECTANEAVELLRHFRRLADRIASSLGTQLSSAYLTPTGNQPIAYIWARTIRCEGPACGVELPLVRNPRLSQRGRDSSWLKWRGGLDDGRLKVDVIAQGESPQPGIIQSGSATCPRCGYTTPNAAVRAQLAPKRGGANDARLLAVIEKEKNGEVLYRPCSREDVTSVRAAEGLLARMIEGDWCGTGPVPDEPVPKERPSPNARGLSAVTRIGVTTFGDLYTTRQKLVLVAMCRNVREKVADLRRELGDEKLAGLVGTLLAAAVGKRADFGSSLCSWRTGATCVRGTFARQALSIAWDFGEMHPLAGSAGDWREACRFVERFISHLAASKLPRAHAALASATDHPLPDDGANALVTDPPYYDSVPYADLSDYCYVWLRRALPDSQLSDCQSPLTPKDDEAIWNPSRFSERRGTMKDKRFYESMMKDALVEARRVARPDAVGVVVFAHKSTEGWEAILAALISAGWSASGSWPLDTERAGRTNSVGTASLASSVHVVCRPRENPDGSLREHVGEWREVLAELPKRIHEWMPRLAKEGVVGADAIFACLGPALEIFSRYSRVEKASGEAVTLGDYLEQVWAAVSKEALSLVFEGADATELEPDARLTAMWLWTLGAGPVANGNGKAKGTEAQAEDDEDSGAGKTKASGYTLEFDAARKIAQGLGAHLDKLPNVVEIKGDKARLLSVAERTKHLFGKDTEPDQSKPRGRKKETNQLSLFEELDVAEAAAGGGWGSVQGPAPGTTVLDRVHQAMILFAAGRGEALKRFLVEDGAGTDARFWKLAQSLSALYPTGTDEKRWVDGVLGRKKGLGL